MRARIVFDIVQDLEIAAQQPSSMTYEGVGTSSHSRFIIWAAISQPAPA